MAPGMGSMIGQDFLKKPEPIPDAQLYELRGRLWTFQQGLCAVCTEKLMGNAVAVDHDHSTGHVRGLVCYRCNAAVAFVDAGRPLPKGLAQFLDAAKNYVASPPAYKLPKLTAKAKSLSKPLKKKIEPIREALTINFEHPERCLNPLCSAELDQTVKSRGNPRRFCSDRCRLDAWVLGKAAKLLFRLEPAEWYRILRPNG
jgi:hypothetical protein